MKVTFNTAKSFHQQGCRDHQEDARYPDADTAQSNAFVVCDGVGGQQDGEVASAVVSATFGQLLSQLPADGVIDADTFSQLLAMTCDALEHAPGSKQKATTLTLLAAHGAGVLMAHIGDSRIYQLRPGQGIVYQTEDHSLVQEMVRSGAITAEKARNHPLGNVITRSMSGGSADRCPATVCFTSDVQPGDVFLLCTDGVVHQAPDELLEQLLLSDATDEEKCSRLAQLSAPSQDNNTAILVSVQTVADNDDQAPERSLCDIAPAIQPDLVDKVKRFFRNIF